MNWMAWTPVTAIFFLAIGVLLILMTALEIKLPTTERKGFLLISTTRGDRFFIGLLGSAYIHLAFLAVTEISLWLALTLSLLWSCAVLRWC